MRRVRRITPKRTDPSGTPPLRYPMTPRRHRCAWRAGLRTQTGSGLEAEATTARGRQRTVAKELQCVTRLYPN
jgi:hypothetical protein